MKTPLLFTAIFGIAISSGAQTIYVPGGSSTGITTTAAGVTSKVGIGSGASSPLEMLHVFGNVMVGDPGPSTAASYYIRMPGGASTINGGNGRNLVLEPGSSDNQASAGGGRLYLRAGRPTLPSNNYGTVIIADEGGKVGIGTESPYWLLDVNGQISARGQAIVDSNSTSIHLGDLAGQDGYRDYLHFYTHDTNRMTIDGSGNVGIGTQAPDAKLAVVGQIHAQEVKISATVPGPDYVFAKDYTLPTLAQVESYIANYKHLPEVPSAKEMEENGIQLGEMNMLLLKKIEELTLYMIEQEKKMDGMQKQIDSIKK